MNTASGPPVRRERDLTHHTRVAVRLDRATRSGQSVDIAGLLRVLAAWAHEAREHGATDAQIQNASLGGLWSCQQKELMTTLRAVALPDQEAGAGLQVAVGDTYVLHTDPEALLLCALMWSYYPAGDTSETVRITATLTGDDFDDYIHSRLFTVIADLVAAEQPFDQASVTNEVIRSGSAGDKDGPLCRRLLNIATLGAFALTATHNADIVLSQSYRGSFHTAGTAITEAAAHLARSRSIHTGLLFWLMKTHFTS